LNKTPVKSALLCVFLCAALSAGALDFGLVLNQELKLSNEIGDGAFFYTPRISPWVSGPLGGQFYLYLSGRLGFEYANSFGEDSAWRDPPILPELDRSEFTWFVSPALSLTLGRQRLRDPAGLVVSGLFDGLRAGFSAGGGRFSAGAWYTGLLHKDTAKILISSRDRAEQNKPWDLDGTYFASRRMLVSFDWENPGLSPRSSLALGFLGQFDLNEGNGGFHSQYLSALYGLRFSGGSTLEGSAVLGIGEPEDGEPGVFFAGALEGSWALPGAPEDRLSLRGLYASPGKNDRLISFVPVNSLPQGQVFSPALGGISLLKTAYTVRPRSALALTAEGAYFIRTDTVSFRDGGEPDKLKGDGYFLGGELYGTARWSPLPDLALTLGAGAFFPFLGNAFDRGADLRWKMALGLILSL
jgi:hypothetical protein